MAQFYGSISGQAKTDATKRGSKVSELDAHIRGWNIGARVVCQYDSRTGKDVVEVYQTGGSNGATSNKLIATLTEE